MALVIFDLDGTLVDSVDDLCNSVNAARAYMGLPPLPRDLIASYVGNGAPVLIRRAMGPEATEEQVQEALAFFLSYYREHMLDHTRPYPGVVETLEKLERQVEEELGASFPQDRIEAVSTGRRGADVLQVVCDASGRECGTILWEAKRTKAWSDGWLEKLREDQREAGADVAVIVSTVLPRDIRGIGMREGVWVCDYPSFTGLATALRAALMQVHAARQAEVGKGHKMELLYDYLSGPEFRQRVEAMVESLRAMHQDLEKEKTAMQKIWKKREKQMQRILASTAAMYGEMQGIIGASMPELAALDLKAIAPAPDDPEEGEIVI